MTTSSLEDLITRAGKLGLRFAGLHEKPVFAGKGWRCSLAPTSDAKADWFNGEGATPAKAMQKALDAAKAAGFKPRFTDLEDIL